MSPPNPARLPHCNGHNGANHLAVIASGPNGHEASAALDLWGTDDALREEIERLTAQHEQIRTAVGLDASANGASHDPAPPADETAQLRDENAGLRGRLEEVEQLLLATAQQREEVWAEQQKEYEALLEEKSEVIRSLHLQVQELKEAVAAAPRGEDPCGLSQADQQELLALQAQMAKERRQLEEDEDALMGQMKQMEMTMSRERVELARQRSELQRLHSDFQHEVELASRDGILRERLLPLQRRHQEILNAKGMAPAQPARPAPQANPTPPTPGPAPGKGSSGLFRRLFRGSGGSGA